MDKLSRGKRGEYSIMSSSNAVPPEQACLLGSHSGVDDIDLRNIQLTVANSRTLDDDGSTGTKQTIDTRHGPISISVSGDISSKPVILTYHDLGLNQVTNFQAFMQYPDTKSLLRSFCVVHINAPGQEMNALSLPEGYIYPTMEELSETIVNVKNHFQIRSFIGLGIGLGANILARYSIKYPQDIDGLFLINCYSTASGWIEWGSQKINVRQLKGSTMTTATVDYLMWHHFGRVNECNQDLVTVYRHHFEKSVNATNLALLIGSYIQRTDLGIVRELDPNKKKEVKMIRCPVLNMTSNFSPHSEDTITFNSRLDPCTSTWMKVQDCGMVIDEQPGKVVEALRLFLQGLGYAVSTSRRASSISFGEGKSV